MLNKYNMHGTEASGEEPLISYALRQVSPPNVDLGGLTDRERLIEEGRVWCIKTIQEQLSLRRLSVIYSPAAQQEAHEKLAWDINNACAFISCLTTGRYVNSQWAYSTNGKRAYAADAYHMGFNRHKGVENQKNDPWVYFKFTIIPQTHKLIILSSHPSTKS
ncbi:MAG: hypothetical protein ACN6O3_06350 [Comamonas sp.]